MFPLNHHKVEFVVPSEISHSWKDVVFQWWHFGVWLCPTLRLSETLVYLFNIWVFFTHEHYSVIKSLVWLQTCCLYISVAVVLWQYSLPSKRLLQSFVTVLKNPDPPWWFSLELIRQSIFWANCQRSLYLYAKKSSTLATINVLWSCL